MAASLILVLCVALALVGLGLRLAMQGVQEKQLPEALLGLGFCLGSGGIGMVACVNAQLFPASWGLPAAHASVTLSLSFFVAFCLRVFHRSQPAAWILGAAMIALLAGSWWAFVSTVDLASAMTGQEPTRAHFFITLTRMPPFAWLMFDTLSRHRLLRRRLAFGLSDPIVVNRFLLWATWTGCLFALPAVGTVLLLMGQTPESSPIFFALAAPFGALSAVTLWLSFFPPQGYRSWLAIRPA